MSNSQAEIKAIQERLRAIRSELAPTQKPHSNSLMVELFPHTTATVTPELPTRPPDTATVEALSAALRSRLTPELSPRSEPVTRSATPTFQHQLEVKVQQINELSAMQEAAMLELKTLAEKLERDRRAVEAQGNPLVHSEEHTPVCEYVTTAVPHIERHEAGAFVVTTRPIDLFRAEREATLTAYQLRHTATRSGVNRQRQSAGVMRGLGMAISSPVNLLQRWLSPPSKTFETARTARRRTRMEPLPGISLQEGIFWFVGAMIVRVAIDALLVSFPNLWLPAVALIVAPAAIAIYRTTVHPQSSINWGYRLLAIMLGLLLGGRLL